jgi:hypothetical protein
MSMIDKRCEKNGFVFLRGFCCLLGLVLIAGCSTTPPPVEKVFSSDVDVYFGGVWFVGSQLEIPQRFDLIYPLFNDEKLALQKKYMSFFEKNASVCEHISLKTGQLATDAGSQHLLALAFSDQRVSSEKVGRAYKSVVNLSGYLLVVDFRDRKVVAAYPQTWEIIHSSKKKPSRRELQNLLAGKELGVTSDFFLNAIQARLPQVAVLSGSASTLQVKNIGVSDAVWKLIAPKFEGQQEVYKGWVAEEVSSSLSTELGVPVMPYQRNAALANMSLMLANGEMQNFKLNSGTYGVDVELDQFKRIKVKETATQALWLYGTYLTSRLYEPEFDLQFYEGKTRGGAQKKIPVAQADVDHVAAYQDGLRVTIKKMAHDMWEDKTGRETLEKCQK